MIVRLRFTRRKLAEGDRALDKLTRYVQAERRERLHRGRLDRTTGHVIVPGAVYGRPGVFEIRGADELYGLEWWARFMTSCPPPLSPRQRAKIKKR